MSTEDKEFQAPLPKSQHIDTNSIENNSQKPPYEAPSWSAAEGLPGIQLQVLKGGIIIETLDLSRRPYYTIGRVETCDLQFEHASISRFHSVFQLDKNGQLLVFDLNSTHGTFKNKIRCPSKVYIKLNNGDQIRFGESSRSYIVINPNKVKVDEPVKKENTVKSSTDEVNWGFQEDAEPNDGDIIQSLQPVSLDNLNGSTNMKNYEQNPKVALREYLESQDHEVKYHITQSGSGANTQYTAKIKLPVLGNPEVLEELEIDVSFGAGTGSSKREAERLAALDACKKLDKLGVFQSNDDISAEDLEKIRIKRLLEDIDSDEENFYDDTKKSSNSDPSKKSKSSVENLVSLKIKHKNLTDEIEKMETKIAQIRELMSAKVEDEDNQEELDAYLKQQINGQRQKEIQTLLYRIQKNRVELNQVNKLLKLVQ